MCYSKFLIWFLRFFFAKHHQVSMMIHSIKTSILSWCYEKTVIWWRWLLVPYLSYFDDCNFSFYCLELRVWLNPILSFSNVPILAVNFLIVLDVSRLILFLLLLSEILWETKLKVESGQMVVTFLLTLHLNHDEKLLGLKYHFGGSVRPF